MTCGRKKHGLRGDSHGGSQLEEIMCRDGQDEEIVQHSYQVKGRGGNDLMWVSASSHATIMSRQDGLDDDGGSTVKWTERTFPNQRYNHRTSIHASANTGNESHLHLPSQLMGCQ